MEFIRIRDINDPLAQVIKDDPVRPHIPLEQGLINTIRYFDDLLTHLDV